MYKKKGQIQQNVGAIIAIVIGTGVAALVLIFVGTLGASVYEQVEDKIVYNDSNSLSADYHPGGITDKNIAWNIRDSIYSSFTALETTGNYLPIVVLAVIIFIVLGLVMGMGGQPRSYGGGAL